MLSIYRHAVASAKDEKIQKAMSRLLTQEQDSFRPAHDILRLFNDPKEVFSYPKLMDRTDTLLQAWTAKALGEPNLAELYLPGSDAASKQERRDQERRKRLQDSRARLNEQVVDPLPHAIAIAEKARRLRNSTSLDDDIDDIDEVLEKKQKHRKRRGNFLDKKKSATKINFNNSDDDDDEEEHIEDPEDNGDGAVLTSPKKIAKTAASTSPRKWRKSQTKKYEGNRIWTESETTAIKQGIAEFGWGKWAQIKDQYKIILKDRTSGQIKVCGNELPRNCDRTSHFQ